MMTTTRLPPASFGAMIANKQLGRTDVPGVEDVLDVCETLENFRAELAVGIADQADAHAYASGSPLRQRGPMPASMSSC